MREWEDDHPAPNLDFRVCRVRRAARAERPRGGRARVCLERRAGRLRAEPRAYSDDEEEGEAEEDRIEVSRKDPRLPGDEIALLQGATESYERWRRRNDETDALGLIAQP